MTAWRDHPKLRDRFHPEAPDDLQVVVHDGGPKLTNRAPEKVWVTVSGVLGDPPIFSGRVLNPPHQLQTVAEGAEVKFVASAEGHLLMVTEKYLTERPAWTIHPCDQCGLDELFDAPSDLMRVTFPDLPAGSEMQMFTVFCGLCGGVQGIEAGDEAHELDEAPSSAETGRKWWQFWR